MGGGILGRLLPFLSDEDAKMGRANRVRYNEMVHMEVERIEQHTLPEGTTDPVERL